MRVEEIMVNPGGKGRMMVVTLDQRELAVILFEAMLGVTRPPGATVTEALADIEQREPDLAEVLQRQAGAALEYVAERMNAAQPEAMQ